MKYKTISNFLIATGVIASFFLLTKNPAYASPVSLSVYPPVIEIQSTTPANIQTPVIIQNNSNQNVELTIGLKPFKARNNFNGQVNYFPTNYSPQPDKNIYKYVTILYKNSGIKSLTLAPKDKKSLLLNIALPANEPNGDYYFSLVFLSIPPQNTQNTGTIIQTGIATNVLLSIGKRTQTQAEIASFSAPGYISHGPVPFSILLKNDNNQILAPSGHILITNMFGQTIGNVIIPRQYILANSGRFLTNGYSYNYEPVSQWNQSFLLGPYSAKLQISLADKEPIIDKTIYFFAFPTQAVGLLLLGLVLVLLIGKRVRKKINSK